MANKFNDNTNKKNLGWDTVSYTTYRTNYSNDKMMEDNDGMPPSGGGNLEDNKTATIDVSTYTQPVEITPSEGKDGMKKATVTLSNIPSGGGEVIFYYWSGATNAYTMSEHPNVGDYVYERGYNTRSVQADNKYEILAVGEGAITIFYDDEDTVLNRGDSANDLHFVKSST